MIKLSGISSFQWSTDEQVYPFEKTINGDTLYCKEIDMGSMGNYSYVSKPHGISPYTNSKLYRVTGVIYNTVGADTAIVDSPAHGGNYIQTDATNVYLQSLNANWSMYKARVQVIYWK